MAAVQSDKSCKHSVIDLLVMQCCTVRTRLCFLNEPLSLMNESTSVCFVRVLSRLLAECVVLLCLQPRTVLCVLICRCNNTGVWCTQGLLVFIV